MNKDKNEQRKAKEQEWRKTETTQYLLRFTNASGVPAAIDKAAPKAKETPSEYMKNAIVMRLQKDGFLKDVQFVANLNRARHKKKLEELKKYIEREEQKMK